MANYGGINYPDVPNWDSNKPVNSNLKPYGVQVGGQLFTGKTMEEANSKAAAYKASPLYKPTWLEPEYVNTLLKPMQDSYNGIAEAYNPSAQLATLQNQYDSTLRQGKQSADSAVSEYATRNMLSGGNAEGAGALKAQLGLAAQDQANQYSLKGATISDTARQEANKAQLGAASTMSQIHANYLGTLASYYSNMQSAANQRYATDTQMNIAKLNADTSTENAKLAAQVALVNSPVQNFGAKQNLLSTLGVFNQYPKSASTYTYY